MGDEQERRRGFDGPGSDIRQIQSSGGRPGLRAEGGTGEMKVRIRHSKLHPGTRHGN